MKISSAKAKGRKLVIETKQWLHKLFPHLENDDIIIPNGSANGEDLTLSPLARKSFPFSIECKYQEGLSKIYDFMDQAKNNAGQHIPIVMMRSNRKEPLVLLTQNDFEKIVKGQK